MQRIFSIAIGPRDLPTSALHEFTFNPAVEYLLIGSVKLSAHFAPNLCKLQHVSQALRPALVTSSFVVESSSAQVLIS